MKRLGTGLGLTRVAVLERTARCVGVVSSLSSSGWVRRAGSGVETVEDLETGRRSSCAGRAGLPVLPAWSALEIEIKGTNLNHANASPV